MKPRLLLLLILPFFAPLFAEEKREETSPKEGYTINYKTVSILEYIRFASKICNVNFIFNEEELNFSISVISDEPITPKDVMATLLQMLRIHGFTLLEQGGSLVIHKSSDVRQIATLVTGESQEGNAPLVTRIFRITNAKAESLAAILRPMISSSAILEVSPDTRQIILTDITANVDKVASLIENLDTPHTLLDIGTYDAVYNTPTFLIELASQIMDPIAQGNPFILVPQGLSNSIFIVSTPDLTKKTLTVLTNLDKPPKKEILTERKLKSENIFVYKVLNRPGAEILKGLSHIGETLQESGAPDPDLIQTLETAKWIPDTNSILVVGSKASIEKVKEFLASLDVVTTTEKGERYSFFVYKPQNRNGDEVEKAILEIAGNLKKGKGGESATIETIQSVKLNRMTQTLTFSGEEKTFARVRELLAIADSGALGSGVYEEGEPLPASNQFYIYKPRHQQGEALVQAVKEMTKELQESPFTDPALIRTLQSMKWVPSTQSLLFTGDSTSIKKLEAILNNLDGSVSAKPGTQTSFFLYQPQNASRDKTEAYLKQLGDNLNKRGEEDLIATIRSAKWIEASHSFLFHGSENSVNRLKEILKNFDEKSDGAKSGYYVYKLQNTTGDVVEEDLDNLSKNLKKSDARESQIIDVIDKMRYIKETNSLLLTGNPQAIEEVKALIAEYDTQRAAKVAPNTNFFMYKPQYLTASQIQSSMKEIAENLQKGNLADPALLGTIRSAKYVESTNSLIFTGPAETLQKVQTLIQEVDIAPQKHAPLQHVGKTTFLLYKLQNASGPNITSSIKAIASDLKAHGTQDKDFLAALNSMKYVKETNSLLFTGTEEALTKVQTLVEKFDVTSLAAPVAQREPIPQTPASPDASNFFVYKPQSLPGPELEKVMQDFAENLKSSGLSDPSLFNAITSMRWVEKTQTILFTGTPKALDQIKELLALFDIPANLPEGSAAPEIAPPDTGGIQAIDNTSFLVYKLQFHKGDEIQGALRQIAKDLILSNAAVNQNLLNSINSIQWLEVTNSLLCSGDSETLTRLRELIKNLDIPLKQVFIEMLVLETTLVNGLNFGLEWGGNIKYRDRFAASMNNTIPSDTGTVDTFVNNLSALVPTSTSPTPQLIPPTTGFDFGVIGDIIKHNGNTYLTLGSLVTALQSDTETSIIMTPKILTQDGRTSNIFIGENIPFVGSFVSNSQQSGTLQTSNIEYRDIGFNLVVTPVLGNSDIVTLDINLDRSIARTDINGNTINFNTTTAQGVTTAKTTMQTTVHVPDNNFLVLSGMVNNNNTKIKTGLPCLGGLPLIGAAFSKSTDSLTNSNIVIFIRPHIINSIDDMRKISNHEQEYFREEAGTPFLEHQYDDGIERLKTVDDE